MQTCGSTVLRFVRRSTTYAFIIAAVFVFGRAIVVRADQDNPDAKKPPVRAKISELAWMQGHWRTEFGENVLEEIWSPPAGDSMMSAFAWIKGGKLWMNELLTIVAGDDAVTFRFKHFGREMVGWEEKDEALTFTLVELSGQRAVFENPERDNPRRMTYHRTSARDLLVRVESYRDGKIEPMEFTYKKVD